MYMDVCAYQGKAMRPILKVPGAANKKSLLANCI
jgi:hypothetical protein